MGCTNDPIIFLHLLFMLHQQITLESININRMNLKSSTGCSLSDQHILFPINPKYNDWFCQIYKDLNKLFVNLTKSVIVVSVNWWQNMLILQRITCNWKIQSNFTNIQKWMQYRFEIGRRLFYASLVLKIPISNLMVVIGKFLHRNFLIQAS